MHNFGFQGKIFSGIFFLGVILIIVLPSRPEFIIAGIRFQEKKGEEAGQKMRKELVACGPEAIGPTIEAIRRHGLGRGYIYLVAVLSDLGEPAHKELLRAIDAERDAFSRSYLIMALQGAFSDYSRLFLWVKDVETISEYKGIIRMMEHFVKQGIPETPSLITPEGEINRESLDWWMARSKNMNLQANQSH